MKTKYLFGMLLSGAMLAACSTEDDLNLSKKQEATPSAPVFTVNFEDDGVLMTRASLNAKYGVEFDGTDKMSLFNGVNESTGASWTNAVYSGKEGDGEAIFTTPAMVNKGLAVMVYPADTEFNNLVEANVGKAAPAIIIPAVQDETTKLLTPYMSEFINITYDGEDGSGVAGYNKDYDIAMKRVGSMLFLNMDIKESDKLSSAIETADVPEIEITKVELNAGTTAFTTAIKVIKGENTSGDQQDAHPSWVNKSTLDLTTEPETANLGNDIEAQVQKLTTTDLGENKDKATFTLLPMIGSVTVSDAEVVVYTTYGTVTVDNDTDDKAWTGKGGKKSTVSEGLGDILKNDVLWAAPTSSKNFAEEEQGGYMNRTITIDMANLDMDGLHVASGEQLVNALKVYNAYCPGTEVKFNLDGSADEEVFSMTAAELEKAQELIGENPVTLTPCTEPTEKCSIVEITGGNNTEIPSLSFGGEVTVKLSGSWKYTDVQESDEKTLKEFENVKELVLLENGTLELKNTIATTNSTLKLVVYGKVNVSGQVVLKINTENHGVIKVPTADDVLSVKAATLENMSAVGKKVTAWDNANESEESGVNGRIFNAGIIGNTKDGNGKINNYGVIKLTEATARLYINENGDTSASVETPFNQESNRIGSIVLKDETAGAQNVVVDGTQKGFIKLYKTDGKEVNADNVGTIANYIIAGGACTALNVTDKKAMGSQVLYVEVQSSKEVVFGSAKITAFTLEALIIPTGKKVNIPTDLTLTINKADYVEGVISMGGSMTGSGATKFTNYFGESNKSGNNIITY